MISKEFHNKLLQEWSKSEDGENTMFSDWLLIKVEKLHNQNIKLSGDLGEAYGNMATMLRKKECLDFVKHVMGEETNMDVVSTCFDKWRANQLSNGETLK